MPARYQNIGHSGFLPVGIHKAFVNGQCTRFLADIIFRAKHLNHFALFLFCHNSMFYQRMNKLRV